MQFKIFYRDVFYDGSSPTDVVTRLWEAAEGEDVYSKNRHKFISNLMLAIAKGPYEAAFKPLLKLRYKADKTEREYAKQAGEAYKCFVSLLRERKLFKEDYLLALGKISKRITIVQATKEMLEPIEKAESILLKFLPDILKQHWMEE